MANCAPLLADGGSMRIVSRMAAYTWGTYGNTWPEGFDAPEPPGDDRELGFVSKLPGRTPGKFGRMFVRADASVDAVQKRSDVEDILDAAAKRTSGEVYFEREIGPEGHGRMVPYVDFDVNDFVPVRVWGRVLKDNLVPRLTRLSKLATSSATTPTLVGRRGGTLKPCEPRTARWTRSSVPSVVSAVTN